MNEKQGAHPKILVVDCERDVVKALQIAGYNAVLGSFGARYMIAPDSVNRVVPNSRATLPNVHEQEIVIVDLAGAPRIPHPDPQQGISNAIGSVSAPCDSGEIDTRPLVMTENHGVLSRILVHGGVIVVFGEPRRTQRYNSVVYHPQMHEHRNIAKMEHDNWSFLPNFQHGGFDVQPDCGEEMRPAVTKGKLGELVTRHLVGKFSCWFQRLPAEFEWTPVAKNKFGHDIGAIGTRKEGLGVILLLPHLSGKQAFLLDLIKDVLPELVPNLFPHADRASWIHLAEYEIPSVLRIREQIREYEDEARKRVAKLDANIEIEYAEHGYVHNLITGTDRTLVDAVIKVLSVLGFKEIIDVDEDRRRNGETTMREDLWIKDRPQTLIVDVKGVGGHPSDDEARQAQKHATIRLYEWNATPSTVQGLTIINHQRFLPPLDRENTMPFRQEILDAAKLPPLGLLTTWDLVRILRSYQRNGWKIENIQDLFYGVGRIDIVPVHYHFVGKVARSWETSCGVTLENGELHPGDRLAIETPLEFEEITIESLQVKDESVPMAKVGDDTGIRPAFRKGIMREGTRLFRVFPS